MSEQGTPSQPEPGAPDPLPPDGPPQPEQTDPGAAPPGPHPQPEAPAPPSTTAGFRSVAPAFKRYELVGNLVETAVLVVALTAGGLWAVLGWEWPWPACLGIGGGVAALSLWFSLWYPPRHFQRLAYRLDQEMLEIQDGVIFHHRRLIPRNRVQHVDIRRGPIERWYGLASLVLHTAGTHGATVTLPGLDPEDAMWLRGQLVTSGGDDAV